jgi:hypothetical protein
VRSLAPSPMPTRMFAPEDESPPGRASCTSTIGDGCITNATHLRYALLQAQPGETIALCGGGNLPPITTEDGPLIVQEFNIVLCCADMMMTRHCEIRGNGMHRNLIVTGANITLQGLLFSNGFGLNGDGGNVEIRATGHHRIIHCQFVNGTATKYGGNLAVKRADTVVVQDSTFSFGLGLGGAGGLYIEASKSIVVNHSIFEGNVCGTNVGSTTGGGLLVEGGRSVEIVQSYFVGNSADLGGGFFVSHLGSFPTLKILQCRFELNSAVAWWSWGIDCTNSSVYS